MTRTLKLTQEALKNALDYDRSTGEFRWRSSPSRKVASGAIAGRVCPVKGYRAITFLRVEYLAHRLAWLYEYGVIPPMIDHINGRRDDNRIENLRPATSSINNQNRALNKNRDAGMRGVTVVHGKYRANIKHKGHQQCLGTFESQELARAAYLEARSRLYEHQPVPRDY